MILFAHLLCDPLPALYTNPEVVEAKGEVCLIRHKA